MWEGCTVGEWAAIIRGVVVWGGGCPTKNECTKDLGTQEDERSAEKKVRKVGPMSQVMRSYGVMRRNAETLKP